MPPDDVAAKWAALSLGTYLLLRSAAAEAAHSAGHLTDAEYAALEEFYIGWLASRDREPVLISLASFELGVDSVKLSYIRDQLRQAAVAAERNARTFTRHPRSRRPHNSRQRSRRNVRTRRAKARSPGSSDDDGSSEGESGPAAHSRTPLDLFDAIVLALGWGRV